jgi:hydrogenase maturation factor
MKKEHERTDVRQAVAPNTGAPGELTGIAINGTGFNRARFIFNFAANTGTSAALSAGIGVYNAATSGAAYTLQGSLAAVTSGVLGSNIMVVDVPVVGAKPWMKVSGGSILSTGINNSCLVELYRAIDNAPAATPQQIVIV